MTERARVTSFYIKSCIRLTTVSPPFLPVGYLFIAVSLPDHYRSVTVYNRPPPKKSTFPFLYRLITV